MDGRLNACCVAADHRQAARAQGAVAYPSRGAPNGPGAQYGNAVQKCVRSGGPHGICVRSWVAMEDQFRCHAAAAASSPVIARAIGTNWDLKGHRYPTNSPYTWATTRCNW